MVGRAAVLARLSPLQRRVVEEASARAMKASPAAIERLANTAAGQGYTRADLERVLVALRDELPIHIHFHADAEFRDGASVRSTLDAFVRAGRYRSLWQTGRSSGNADLQTRGRAERTLYHGIYTEPPVPAERPVHGLVNLVDGLDPSATQYGDAVLVLRPEVKHRATLTGGDAFGAASEGVEVGTFDHPAPGLPLLHAYLLDRPLPLFERALGRPTDPAWQRTRDYVDVAIHGPVDFRRDVAELRMPRRLRGTAHERAAIRFSRTYDVPLRWTDGFTADPRPGLSGWGGAPPTALELRGQERARADALSGEARLRLDRGALLLDVRHRSDRAAGPVGARRIPVEALTTRVAELGAPRSVVVFSTSAARSALAAEILRAHRTSDVLELDFVPDLVPPARPVSGR